MLVTPKTEHGVISRGGTAPFGYHGWPSVCIDENHILYAVCSGGRMLHVCPFGKTYLFRSADLGKTWSSPMIVNDTPLDDRDAGIIAIPGGRLLVSWFIHPFRVYDEQYRSGILNGAPEEQRPMLEAAMNYGRRYIENPELGGSFVRLSEDGGFSWGETVRLPVSAPHGPILLKNGTLLYVGTEMYTDELPKGTLAAYTSPDCGRTWEKLSMLPAQTSEEEGYYEPHAVELPGGRILAAIRAEGGRYKERFTFVTTCSDDGGKTWSPLRDCGCFGSPPHLLLHSSGALICSVGWRRPPFGQRAYISYDCGETWADEYVLRDDEDNGDLGYPCTVELPDGGLLTVYYQRFSPEDGKNRSLLYTKWRLAN